jgi:hypothetical protein
MAVAPYSSSATTVSRDTDISSQGTTRSSGSDSQGVSVNYSQTSNHLDAEWRR